MQKITIYITAALAIALLAVGGMAMYWRGNSIRSDAQAEKASLALATAAAEAQVYKFRTLALNAIAEQYERDKQDAQQAASDVIDDLRTGNLRMREQWRGCETKLPGVTPGAGESDDQDRLRAESAGRIIRAVAECQAQRDGLQAVIESYQ